MGIWVKTIDIFIYLEVVQHPAGTTANDLLLFSWRRYIERTQRYIDSESRIYAIFTNRDLQKPESRIFSGSEFNPDGKPTYY